MSAEIKEVNLNELEEKSSVPITVIKSEEKPESETVESENNDDINSTQLENESDESEKPTGDITVKKLKDIIADTEGSFTTMANMVTNGDYHICDACLFKCATIEDLEQHKSSNLHYVCNIGPKCTIGFSSQAELSNHQAEHQNKHPVQQMAQQVERIPFNYNYRQISNQVMLTPVAQKRSLPPPETPSVAKRLKIKLPDCITLVKNERNPANVSNIANIFEPHSVTVVPSSSVPHAPSTAPRSLLNGSVSITPSRKSVTVVPSSSVPHAPSTPPRSLLNCSVSKAPSRKMPDIPTINLTEETKTPRQRVVTPQKIFICQVCDKVFRSQEILSTHMSSHGTPSEYNFQCEVCSALYLSAQGLETHKQKFHPNLRKTLSPAKPQAPLIKMGLPVVDIGKPGVKQKLLQIGICHVLKLNQLQNAGLPVVPVDTANNQAFCTLGDNMSISNMLPLDAILPL